MNEISILPAYERLKKDLLPVKNRFSRQSIIPTYPMASMPKFPSSGISNGTPSDVIKGGC